MQRNEIEAVKDFLLGLIPQFDGNGYILQKGNDDAFRGVTDDIPFWFYLDFQDGIESFEFDDEADNIPSKNGFRVTGNYKLVAAMTGTEKHNAIQSLVSALSLTGAGIQKAWTDSEVILSEEMEGMELKSGLQLYKINFQLVTFGAGQAACVALICDDCDC